MTKIIYLCHIQVSKMKNTKENIIQAAILLLEEDKNCSLETIATKAGVSRRTLHRYFDGKEELVIAVFETLADKYYEGLMQIIEEEKTIIETLRSIMSYDLSMFSRHNTVCYLYESYSSIYKFDEEDLMKIEEEGIKIFSKLREEGHCNQTFDFQWVNAFFDNIVQLGYNQIQNGIEYEVVEKTIWELFWKGISK